MDDDAYLEIEFVRGRVDEMIRYWRLRGNGQNSSVDVTMAQHYIDALQSLRVSLLGELLMVEVITDDS